MRIIFAGTPDFAAAHLRALIDNEFEVVAVYTQPDRPAGRGKKLSESAVKQLAVENSIPVYQPESLKDQQAQRDLAKHNADIMVVVAYGLLLPKAVLLTPKLGCVNVHGSLLPRWRGAAPIQRAIWAGDNETGITIMQMDEGLDTGDMLHKVSLPITPTDTSASLYASLAELGPKALIEALQRLDALTPQKQDESQATYAKKLSKTEARIDWHSHASQIERNVRAFNPWPVAWFMLNDVNVKVWQSQLASKTADSEIEPGTILSADKSGIVVKAGSDSAICLSSLQLPGKKPMTAAELLNARRDWFMPGSVLLSVPSDE